MPRPFRFALQATEMDDRRSVADAARQAEDLGYEEFYSYDHIGAAKRRLPTMYSLRLFVGTGGLMSYGADRQLLFRRAATYVHKILKGTKPGDLPVEQPTKFDLIINLKTAKQLGLTIPSEVLLQATRVIK